MLFGFNLFLVFSKRFWDFVGYGVFRVLAPGLKCVFIDFFIDCI